MLTADKPGRYGVELIAEDGAASSVPTVATITFYQPNTPPDVTAGADQDTRLFAAVGLLATASDVDFGDAVSTLRWAFIAKPAGSTATLLNAQSATPSFAPDLRGDYLIEVVATDKRGADRASVLVRANNPTTADSDGDGVSDTADRCAGTASGARVDANGCSAGQLPALSITTLIANPASGDAPLTVSFMTAATGGAGGFTFGWLFGDGTTSQQQNPTHLYAQPNTYTANVTATDLLGSTATASVGIVANTPVSNTPKFGAIPDRTVRLGDTLAFRLYANDVNANDTLSYTLLQGPTRSQLTPPHSGLFSFTPANNQVGRHLVRVRVTDAAGTSDEKSFNVTVIAINRAPRFGVLADDATSVGMRYSKTIVASDADGHALTYTLVSGPSGLTLAGHTLSWTPAASQLGSHVVKVQVRDSGQLTDVAMFSISVASNARPIARNDRYQVRLGQTLSIAAAGVLANDTDPDGTPLAATKLTDPDKGTLTAFGADGSFTYRAPPTLPPRPPLQPVLKWHADVTQFSYAMAIGDLDGDGAADTVHLAYNHRIRALRGRDGTVLWARDGLPAPYADCVPFLGDNNVPVIADVDDDGAADIVLHVGCNRDWPGSPGTLGHQRVMALDGHDGSVKWLSPHLLGIVPTAGALPPFNVAEAATLSVARLAPGTKPAILGGFTGENFSSRPMCPWIPGSNAADRRCRFVYALDGADGSVRKTYYAAAPTQISRSLIIRYRVRTASAASSRLSSRTSTATARSKSPTKARCGPRAERCSASMTARLRSPTRRALRTRI